MSDQDRLNHLAALYDWNVSITRQQTVYSKNGRKTIEAVFDADGNLAALRVGRKPIASMSKMMNIARQELQK